MSLLEVKDLVKNYKSSSYVTEVLKGISFDINEGDFLIITGPSGSGKTTLLNCISGLEKITSGDILLEGKSLSKINATEMAKLRKSQIGFVFQAYNLLPNLTLYENVAIAMVIAGAEDEKRITELLTQFGLAEFASYYPNQVSGGMQQRCAIVRSLVNDPKIIFADEPTGNLDSKSGEEVMKTFKMLHQKYGKTIVMVTHALEQLKYATRHIQIIDGKLLADELINE